MMSMRWNDDLLGRQLEIRYTTDGSEPTAKSMLYMGGAITFDSTVTIHAAAFENGERMTALSYNVLYQVP